MITITPQLLGLHARRFLEVLKAKHLTSIETVKGYVGKTFPYDDKSHESLRIYLSPSTPGLEMLRMSYSVPVDPAKEDSPRLDSIEVALNQRSGIRQIQLLCTEKLPNYISFEKQGPHIKQFKKRMEPLTMVGVFQDLETLTELK